MKEIKKTYEAVCMMLLIFIVALGQLFRWIKSLNK